MKEYTFNATIKKGSMGGCYVDFPYSVQDEFGVKGRVKIKCSFDGIPYRGSMVKMKTVNHIILILKSIREELGKGEGDSVEIRLTQDLEERTVKLHPLLSEAFAGNPKVQATYEALSFTNKREIFKALSEAKKEETRLRRLDKILTDLNS